MATAELIPDLRTQTNYETWWQEVRNTLGAMNMHVEDCQENWEFDFRQEFEEGSTPENAAVRAFDFWWEQLLEESWT